MYHPVLTMLSACLAKVRDNEYFDSKGLQNGATLRVSKPQKLGLVIKPEYPWEMGEVGGYDQVLKVGEQDYRFYYTCIGTVGPEGSTQRVCLARSTDGMTWTKPMLGLVSYRNSTQNNIVWPLDNSYNEPGTVFIDDNPAVPKSEKFKMVLSWSPKDAPTGQYALASADGLSWRPMTQEKEGVLKPAYRGSDTQQTAHWDPVLQRYVIFVRGHQPGPAERTVLRCLTTDLTNWTSETNGSAVCPTVLAPDALEHEGTDYYTSGATVYGDVKDGNVLFFPTPYRHFTGHQAKCTCPDLASNCGIVDIRFAFSRQRGAPGTVHWVPADNGRESVIGLGRCTCCDNSCGWCTTGPRLRNTSFDTAELYSVVGYLEAADGTLTFFYNASPWAHGQNTAAAHDPTQPGGNVWGDNHGIAAVRYRRHGFVSIEAPPDFSQEHNRSLLPRFTTKPLTLPTGCRSLEIRANVEASSAGSVYIGVQGAKDYSLASARPIDGNSLHRQATWGGDAVCEVGSEMRSGPAHDGPYCTQCSYELPNGVCGGKFPSQLRCNKTLDCHKVDNGTCHGKYSVCSPDGVCTESGSSRGGVWCRSVNQSTNVMNDTAVPIAPGQRSVVLDVAMVAAKLFAIELSCV